MLSVVLGLYVSVVGCFRIVHNYLLQVYIVHLFDAVALD